MKGRSPEDRLRDRLFILGPKRILVIVGEGLRGVLSTGLLAELELRLARRSGRRNFRLSSYFDLIAGSGMGGLVAAQLAAGAKVTQATRALTELMPDKAALAAGARFDPRRLESALAEFGDRRLDAEGLRTGLALFVMPAEEAVRPLTNIPAPDDAARAAAPLISDAVRACLGGPRLGDRVEADLGAGRAGYVDAALGGAGDPSMLALEVATLAPYGVGWPTGPDLLIMVSVGAGALELKPPPAAPFIAEARRRALVSIQALAFSPEPWPVGGQLGDMRGAQLSPVPMLHLVRLDARLDAEALAGLKLEFDEAERARLMEAAPADEITLARLHEIGLRAGRAALVATEQDRARERTLLPTRFDPASFSYRPLGPPRTRLEALGRAFAERPPEDDEY